MFNIKYIMQKKTICFYYIREIFVKELYGRVSYTFCGSMKFITSAVQYLESLMLRSYLTNNLV